MKECALLYVYDTVCTLYTVLYGILYSIAYCVCTVAEYIHCTVYGYQDLFARMSEIKILEFLISLNGIMPYMGVLVSFVISSIN